PGEQILPPEFLDRGLIGGQCRVLVLIGKARERRQDRLVVTGIDVDLVNGETKAAIEVAVEAPGDDGDIIVGKGDSSGSHRNRPSGGRAMALKLQQITSARKNL